MFPRSKRFRSPVNSAPPVGSYNVKGEAKQGGTAFFHKNKRFGESKENLPGPCDTSTFLNLSTCSTFSVPASNCSSTPRPKFNYNKAKIDELQRTVDDLKEELNYLREQNILVLPSEQLHNTDVHVRASEDREIQTDAIEFEDANFEVKNIEERLENLKMAHKVELEKYKADIDLEMTRNMAFKTRNEALEKSNQELTDDRDQVEEENSRIQGRADELRRENIDLIEKLDLKSQELENHEELNHIATKAEKENEELKAEYTELTKNHEELNHIATKAEKENEELKAENAELTKNHEEELIHVTTKAQKEIEDLKAIHLELTKMHEEELTLTAAKTNKEIETMEAKSETLKAENVEFIKKCKLLEHDLQAQEEQHKAGLAEQKEETEALKAESSELSTKLHVKEQDLLAHVEQFKLVEEECKTLKDDIKELETENSELCEKLDLKGDTLQVLEERLQLAATKEDKEREENKAEIESLKAENLRLTQTLDLKEYDLQVIKEKSKLSEVKREKEIELLNTLVDKEVVKSKAFEEKLFVCMENMKNHTKTTECLTTEKTDLEKKVQELESKLFILEINHEEMSLNYEEDKKRIQGFDELQSQTLELIKKLDLEIVKSKAHEEKYNKCAKEYEGIIDNVTKIAEDCQATNTELLQKIDDLEEKLEKAIEREQESAEQLRIREDENNEMQWWKTKFEELQDRIEPFREQLDAFEAEKTFLLSQHSEAKSEVTKLGEQYAKLLGHQNQKQKIHHVLKLKQENIELKSELCKLRDLCDKQKRSMNQEKNFARKKFNPSAAFSHTRKDSER